MLTEIADIYVRLSDQDRDKKDKSDESESIQNQKTMLIKYCMDRGWQINGIYCDEDYSGADNQRPAWNEVLKDCEEHKCTIVVCKTQSRFSRDMEMIEKYIHGKFLEWGIRFVSVVDNVDTNVKGNKKARQINGLINEWYLEDLSDNIRSTLSSKRKNGEFVGSFAPYGYMIDPNNKNHLIVDEVAAPVVKRIFDMYIHGSGYIVIAQTLNDEKIPPPCVRKKQLGTKYYNTNYENKHLPELIWSDAAVYAIIRRYTYTGALVQGKQEYVSYKSKKIRYKPPEEWDIVEGCHEAIIDKETFNKAQAIRLQRGKGQKFPKGKCYSLARKVFCDVCGNTMWKMSYQLTHGRYNYLRCRTVKINKSICSNKNSIRLDDLEKIVVDGINKLLDEYYDEKEIGTIKTKKRDTQAVQNSMLSELNELENKITKNDARMAQMYTDKLDGIISAEEFSSYRERYQQESINCQKRIEIIKSQLQEYCNPEKPLDTKSVLEKYRHIDELTFEIANEFVNKIFVGELKEDGTRNVRIEWKV